MNSLKYIGKIIILMGLIIICGAMFINIINAETQTIDEFLIHDLTDTHEYLPYYTCGHYARDLARNASEYNITLGGVILGFHPVFRGYQNHIMNYYIDNETIMLIEPQTDQIMHLNNTIFNYYRLYPDGTQVPSNWKCNLAYTGIIT